MTPSEIAQLRLRNQRLVSPTFTNAADVVQWLGAVQAQEYPGAKWAVGQRMRNATDAAIEDAFTSGAILRTHVMRPTWHFVAPADIRWMLELTGPRVKATTASYFRKMELDDRLLRRSNRILERALRDGRQLTRAALRGPLQRAGIGGDSFRMMFIFLHAELDAVVASGALQGKQFTYALFEERAPGARTLERDEALAELTWRYFRSHGPATVADFAWWSGLTRRDVRLGIELVGKRLVSAVIDSRTYWWSAAAAMGEAPSSAAYFLPTYDEYVIAYKDRSASAAAKRPTDAHLDPHLASHLLIGGRLVGKWRRSPTRATANIELGSFAPLRRKEQRAVAEAASRYGAFLGVRAVIE